MKVASTITVTEVNARIKELFAWLPTLTKKPLDSQPFASIFVSAPNKIRKKPFKVSATEILTAFDEAVQTVEPPSGRNLPEELVDPAVIDEKVKKMNPSFIAPIEKRNSHTNSTAATKLYDPISGVTLLQLSNGVKIQTKQTQFIAKNCSIRVTMRGGRSLEDPNHVGSVVLGLPAFISGGAGNWTNDEISKYCNFHGIYIDVR